MDSSKDCFALIAFASRSERNSLKEGLTGIGYTVDLIPSESCLEADALGSLAAAVLFFGKEEAPPSLVESIIDSMPEPPRLGILDSEAPAWGHDLLLHRCTDLVSWPCHERELTFRLQRAVAVNHRPSSAEERGMREEFAGFKLIGRSRSFLRVLALIKKISPCDVPVLIAGETGTGKEVVARAFHYSGPRRGEPFIPVNCGAIPDHLAENELFGHERGAYTDANAQQVGLIGQAKHGTLFLDEIEALSAKGQVALLRFLQDRRYRPLGGTRLKKADVRVIAATNADLQEMVDQRRFRQDLFFRLNIVALGLPSLRERGSDIELLANHFARQYSSEYHKPIKAFHPSTLVWMKSYDWPGNVRELENFVHRGVLLCDDVPVLRLGRPDQGSGMCSAFGGEQSSSCNLSFSQAKANLVADFERSYLTSLMADARGNVTVAARRAGKERRALGKLLKKHHIDRTRYLS